MKPTFRILFASAFLLTAVSMISCKSKTGKEAGKPKGDSIKPVMKKTEKPAEPVAKYERPPIINIVDTVAPKRIVVFCKDSAKTYERISLKLGKIYGIKLADYIKKNGLKTTGSPLAWYTKQKPPYFFEAGMQVNKKGTKAMPGVQLRELGAGKVVLAHFYGPYNLLPQGYDAMKEWIKDNKKIASGMPYEIYVTDPVDKNGKPVDPYKVQTDIVFPIR
jgi:effector-binding domain-containing protein